MLCFSAWRHNRCRIFEFHGFFFVFLFLSIEFSWIAVTGRVTFFFFSSLKSALIT